MEGALLRKDEDVGGVDEGNDEWDVGVAMEVFGVGEYGKFGFCVDEKILAGVLERDVCKFTYFTGTRRLGWAYL